jgi:hypothetical protein
VTWRIINTHRLEAKRKRKEKHFRSQNDIIEKKHIYIDANPLTKVLGLHTTKSFTPKAEIGNYNKRSNLHHLSILLRGGGRHGKIIASS